MLKSSDFILFKFSRIKGYIRNNFRLLLQGLPFTFTFITHGNPLFCREHSSSNQMPTVRPIQFPLNGNVEGVWNKLLFIIEKELLIISIVLFAPCSSWLNDLEDRLQEYPFSTTVHHCNETI